MEENPILSAIYDRRTIRQFTDRPVTEEQLTAILKAGFYAPSAHADHPCHFIILRNREHFDEIMAIFRAAISMRTASTAIVVCGDTVRGTRWRDDGAAASMNMLLAAYSLGLGSCWCSASHDDERSRKLSALLGLPAHIEPYSMIVVGYTDRKKPRPDQFDRTKLHEGRW